MSRVRSRAVSVIVLTLAFTSTASRLYANADSWKLGISGNWETGGNWFDGSTPAAADTAAFGFASTGGAKTLNVAFVGGPQQLDLDTNTTLILGSSAANILNLSLGLNIAAASGSDLEARFGSHLIAQDFGANGLGGQIIVNGVGSNLTLTGTGEHLIGGSSGNGTLSLQNSTASATISGSLGVADAQVAANGNLTIVGNASMTLASDLKISTQNIAGSAGIVSIAGGNTSLTQNPVGTGAVIVGSFNNGSATLNVGGSTNGTLTTGTGGLGIRSTGSMTVGGVSLVGTLNVNGDLYVTGGGAGTGLTVFAGSTFTHAAGKNVFLQAGGQMTLNAEYFTPVNQNYFIDGAGSKLQVNNADFVLGNSAVANVTNGGALTAQYLSVGTNGNGNGTLVVDGVGSTATGGGGPISIFGFAHSIADVTFSNGATGSFAPGLQLAPSQYGDTKAYVTVKTGAHLNTGTLSLANSGSNFEPPTASLTVTDAGSTVNVSAGSTLQLGSPFIAAIATLNVQNDAVLTVGAGGNTAIYPGSVLNINGGSADLKTLNYFGGAINFNSGSLSYIGNLNVGVGGILGTDVFLQSNRTLTLTGTTTVTPFHSLTLSGGSLSTGDLAVNGTFTFTSGTLGITGAGGLTFTAAGPLGAAYELGVGRTLNVTNTTFINADGVLQIDNGAKLTFGALSRATSSSTARPRSSAGARSRT